MPNWSGYNFSGLIPFAKPLDNNLSDCQQPVQRTIKLVRAAPEWGDFKFECGRRLPFDKDGLVVAVEMRQESPIRKRWPEFVRQNSLIFGVDPLTVLAGSDDRWSPYVQQSWNGVNIVSDSFGPLIRAGWSKDYYLATNWGIDTRSWSLDSVPTINSSTASTIARKRWLSQGAEAHDILRAKLVIEIGRDHRCGTPQKPVLVWRIAAAASNRPSSLTCLLDAHSGDVCGWCDTGEYVILSPIAQGWTKYEH
jgi:hypothetical protein